MDSEDNSDSGKEEEDEDDDKRRARLNELLNQQEKYLQMCQTSAKILHVLSGYVGAPQSAHIIELESVSDETDVTSCSTSESSSRTSNNEETPRPDSERSPECVIWAEPLLTCQLVAPEPQGLCGSVRRLPPGVTPEDVKRSKAKAAKATATAAPKTNDASGSQTTPKLRQNAYTDPTAREAKLSEFDRKTNQTASCEDTDSNSPLHTLNKPAKPYLVGQPGLVAEPNGSKSTSLRTEAPAPQVPTTSTGISLASSLATTREDFKRAMTQISSASETIRKAHSLLASMGLGHYSIRRRLSQMNNNNNPVTTADGGSSETSDGQEAAEDTPSSEPTVANKKDPLEEAKSVQNLQPNENINAESNPGLDKTQKTTRATPDFPPLVMVQPINTEFDDGDPKTSKETPNLSENIREKVLPAPENNVKNTPFKSSEVQRNTGGKTELNKSSIGVNTRSEIFGNPGPRGNTNVSANVYHQRNLCSNATSWMRWSSHLQQHQQQLRQASRTALSSRPHAFETNRSSKEHGTQTNSRTQESTTLSSSLRTATTVCPLNKLKAPNSSGGSSEAASNTSNSYKQQEVKAAQSCLGKFQSVQIQLRKRVKHKVTLEDVKKAVDFALNALPKSETETASESKSQSDEEKYCPIISTDVTETKVENFTQPLSPTNVSSCVNDDLIEKDKSGGNALRCEGAATKKVTFVKDPIVINSSHSVCEQEEQNSYSPGRQKSSPALKDNPAQTQDSQSDVGGGDHHTMFENDVLCDGIANDQCNLTEGRWDSFSHRQDLAVTNNRSPKRQSYFDKLKRVCIDQPDIKTEPSKQENVDSDIKVQEKAVIVCALGKNEGHAVAGEGLEKNTEESKQICHEEIDRCEHVVSHKITESVPIDIEEQAGLETNNIKSEFTPLDNANWTSENYEIRLEEPGSNKLDSCELLNRKHLTDSTMTNDASIDNQTRIGNATQGDNSHVDNSTENFSALEVTGDKDCKFEDFNGKENEGNYSFCKRECAPQALVKNSATNDDASNKSFEEELKTDSNAQSIETISPLTADTIGTSSESEFGNILNVKDDEELEIFRKNEVKCNSSPQNLDTADKTNFAQDSSDLGAGEPTEALDALEQNETLQKPEEDVNIIKSSPLGKEVQSQDNNTDANSPDHRHNLDIGLNVMTIGEPGTKTHSPSQALVTELSGVPVISSPVDKMAVVVNCEPCCAGVEPSLSTGDVCGKSEQDLLPVMCFGRPRSPSFVPVRPVSSQSEAAASDPYKGHGRFVKSCVLSEKYARLQPSRPRPLSGGTTEAKMTICSTGDILNMSKTMSPTLKTKQKRFMSNMSSPEKLRPSCPIKRNKYTKTQDSEQASPAQSSSVSVIEMLEEEKPDLIDLPEPRLPLNAFEVGDGCNAKNVTPEAGAEHPLELVKVKADGDSSAEDSDGTAKGQEKEQFLKNPHSFFSRPRRLRFRRRRRSRRQRSSGWWTRGIRCLRSRIRSFFGLCFR